VSGFSGMREVVVPPAAPEPPQPPPTPPETPQEALERLIAEVVPPPRGLSRPRGRPHGAADRHGAPQRLTAALVALRWDRGVLGAAVGRSRQVVASWCDGRGICPPAVLAWAETLAEFHRSHPAP